AAAADTRAPGSRLMQNGQSALPPGTPINSNGQPYSPSLVNMPPDQAANVAASMAAIRQAQAAGQNPYPGAGGANTNAPVGFASIPPPPQPIRLAQNGPQIPGGLAPPSMPSASAMPATPAMPRPAMPIGGNYPGSLAPAGMPQQFPGLPAPPPGQQYNPADLQ